MRVPPGHVGDVAKGAAHHCAGAFFWVGGWILDDRHLLSKDGHGAPGARPAIGSDRRPGGQRWPRRRAAVPGGWWQWAVPLSSMGKARVRTCCRDPDRPTRPGRWRSCSRDTRSRAPLPVRPGPCRRGRETSAARCAASAGRWCDRCGASRPRAPVVSRAPRYSAPTLRRSPALPWQIPRVPSCAPLFPLGFRPAVRWAGHCRHSPSGKRHCGRSSARSVP